MRLAFSITQPLNLLILSYLIYAGADKSSFVCICLEFDTEKLFVEDVLDHIGLQTMDTQSGFKPQSIPNVIVLSPFISL